MTGRKFLEIRTDDTAYLRPLLQICNFLYGTHRDGCCKSRSGILASSAMILSACASLTYLTLENLISSPKTTVSVYLISDSGRYFVWTLCLGDYSRSHSRTSQFFSSFLAGIVLQLNLKEQAHGTTQKNKTVAWHCFDVIGNFTQIICW